MNDLDEIAEAGEYVASTDLKAITALALKQLELEGEVAGLEARIKDAKERLRRVSMNELPAALKAAGVTTFGLDNGMTVAYEEEMSISVPKIRKSAIIEKMREWGYGPNVTKILTVDLGKGGDNVVTALVATAEELGVKATVEEDIPSGTVKKALRVRIGEGKSDDLAWFGAYSITKATVK